MYNFLAKARILLNDIPKPLGRWTLGHTKKQMNFKIDLSNEDHCGPCGQYAVKQMESKKPSDYEIRNVITPFVKKESKF